MHKKNILFLTHHWGGNSHHSKFSGYQALINYASNSYKCSVVTWGGENLIINENGIDVHYVKPYFKKDYLFSKRLAISKYAKKIEKQFDIVHALYSDCGFYQSHPNFYSTFHVSPFVVNNISYIYRLFIALKYLIIEKRVIKNSNKIIIVSNNLRLRQNKSKFIFIPHGVNTDYWTPENINTASIKNQYACNRYALCVGNHGIDKDILHKTIKNNPQINFIVVGLKNFECDLQNLKLLYDITDDELKCLYMLCGLFVRPMSFSTANNSILEALSMGCKIFISTPNGKYDYINRNYKSVKIVKNSNFLTEFSEFYEFSKNWDERQDIRNYAISTYDWKHIWTKTKETYEKNFRP